ncbi:MAG: 4Fe-4S binding protein [Anaerolineae bacterium]|nr:4Fe-4S binding protein [Anaerolineae bacterium]
MSPLVGFAFGFLTVGLVLSIGLYIVWPQAKRPQARRLVMLFVGSLLLGITLVSDRGNMQIEGLFFGALAGFMTPPVLHFAIAKIVGPVFMGRVWCAWACWYAMIFDHLPYPNSRFRRPRIYGQIRYLHFFASLIVVAALWFGLDYREGGVG